jgi:uncharacterized protein (TIGR03032 family)
MAEQVQMELTGSRHLPRWLAANELSLAFTTYQGGKLCLVGLGPEGRLSIFERTFSRCMGMWADGQSIWMSSLYQLWRFHNGLAPGENRDGYDAMYVPRAGYTTGDIDIHDVAVGGEGDVVFISTLFSALGTLSDTASFTPLWRPSFVTDLVPEDRCHLNGLAVRDGKARYVTATSTSNVADGWRDDRVSGGVIIDIDTDEIITTGLSMPHSPRWHNGQLFVLNSGTGHLGVIDPDTGKFAPIAFCPGYLRGLAFAGNHAIVGLSHPRGNKTFQGLPLEQNLKEHGATPRAGLHVINLSTGATEQWLRIEGTITELYDIAVLPKVIRPMALGFKTDEIQHLLTVDQTPEPS